MSTNGIYQTHGATTLATNASATTSGFAWGGGAGMFTAEGTFGGGTVKLQVQTPNGTWVDVGTDTTLTGNGCGGFMLPASKGPSAEYPSGFGNIRVSITTATTVYAYAIGY